MKALRDKIKNKRAAENASRPAETMFLAYKSVKQHAADQNLYINMEL